ncbi:MAG: UDP-N-acetylglucosamine 4,6-dehydratase (inverting) [Solirubrobacterales bacterium]
MSARPNPYLKDKVILITGGTGSFGTAFLKTLLAEHAPAAVRVYSRDELKQYDLQRAMGGDERVRFLIGDVRDAKRLEMAMRGVDVVIHAAALKQVPACEYNPFEAVKTNIHGAENIVTAAIANDVPRTLALSTDKAVNPVNLYGATKLAAEKIITQGNAYAGGSPARFATMRYGNVVGSRGSVIPLFKAQARAGELTITDEAMTRFWITLEQAVEFVVSCLELMRGGEVFVPRIPSMKVLEIAEAIAPGATRRIVGIRPGEKVHEVLLTEDESRRARALEDRFVIYPQLPSWVIAHERLGEELPPGFRYSSDTNDTWLEADDIRGMAEPIVAVS